VADIGVRVGVEKGIEDVLFALGDIAAVVVLGIETENGRREMVCSAVLELRDNTRAENETVCCTEEEVGEIEAGVKLIGELSATPTDMEEDVGVNPIPELFKKEAGVQGGVARVLVHGGLVVFVIDCTDENVKVGDLDGEDKDEFDKLNEIIEELVDLPIAVSTNAVDVCPTARGRNVSELV
jgi:hypothetical protein